MEHVLLLALIMIPTWFLVTYFWPRMLLSVLSERSSLQGLATALSLSIRSTRSPRPILQIRSWGQPQILRLATTGVNRDTLLTIGWLDLSQEPLVLHVPDMADRYYSVQFTDPSFNTNFAYVGTRATGTGSGSYLVSGPGWNGKVPSSVTEISSPNNVVLLIGRVLVKNDSDLAAAHDLAEQIQLTTLSGWQSQPN